MSDPVGGVSACPGCGLANWEGLCPHCRGDLTEYEEHLAPFFGSYVEDADPAPAEDGGSHAVPSREPEGEA